MLVAIIAAAVIQPERDIGALTNVLGLALCGLGVIGLAQAAGVAPGPFAPIFGDERVNGLFYHPNIMGAYLTANVVLFGGIAAYRGRSGLYLLVPIGLGVAGLVATLSRGPILGLLAGFLLVMALLAKRRPAALLALVIMVPLIVAFALPEAPSSQRAALTERFNEALEPDAEPGRKAIWAAAEGQIESHPLTGIGTLTFARTFTQTASTANVDQDVTHAHNLFLEGYLSIGPIGMIGLVWLVAGAVGNFWRASGRRDPEGRKISGFAIGAIGALFSVVISSMVDFPFWQLEMTSFVFLLIGVGSANARRSPPPIADQADQAGETAAKASIVRSR
jgi:O-antigen ligase